VVFVGADSALGSVAAMDMGRSELVINVLLVNVLNENLGCLIIKDLELWMQSSRLEELNRFNICALDFRGRAILDRDSVDGVAIIIIEDKHIFVAG
jgi:hypothetical protein